MADRVCSCGSDLFCPECDSKKDDYVYVYGAHYYIDEYIIEEFAKVLIEQDKNSLESIIDLAKQRIKGICFCDARSNSECICGAWENNK